MPRFSLKTVSRAPWAGVCALAGSPVSSRCFAAAVLATSLLGCSAEAEVDPGVAIALRFSASVGDAPAACGVSYADLGRSRARGQLADARLFVSTPELLGADGDWVALRLDESAWQSAGVALLDFEDGSAGCSDSGNPETNSRVSGQVPPGEYSAVRFRVGVPYELNHLNGALSAPPLNVPGMFWTWQGGYRFVRTDWLVEGGEVPRWNLHLGSTGCVSEAATKPPGQPCSQPNLAHVGLEDFNPEQDIIRVDLSALIAGADLLSNVAGTSPGCMSGVEEAADCEPVSQALGLDQGACVAGCAGQSVFSVEP